jgi:hypothetical protein
MPIIRSSRLYRRLQHVAHDTLCRLAVCLVWGYWLCVRDEGCSSTALLRPSSGARDYIEGYSMWHMTPCVGWPLVWCGVAGCASGMRDVARLHYYAHHQELETIRKVTGCGTYCNLLCSLELLMMGIIVPETCWTNYKFNKPLCSI